MRVLLAHNSLYYPSHGGGDKSNRLLMEALAARGHECRVVARLAAFGAAAQEAFLRDLAARSVPVDSAAGGVVAFRHNGVDVRVLAGEPHLRAYFAAEIEVFSPSVILASTDDPAQLLLEPALQAPAARVVYLARATLALPFGPDCAFASAARTAILSRVDGVVGVSRYVADYIRKWGGIGAVHVPISLLDPGPYLPVGRFDNEFVTLVNPCAVKGISIFLELARRMPGTLFAAVPTWGTNEQDRAALAAAPNVRVLDPVDDIERLLARTRVLLVPSLWAEARSRIVVEAMLRGVPVIASDVGGIPEAKLGVDYLLPVRPIEHYQGRLDEQMVPVADVPPQDVGPWERALTRLVTDRAHYEDLSAASREAALRFAGGLSVEPFERFLEDVLRSPKRTRAASQPAQGLPASALDRLSPEKRRLLALRLRKLHPAAPPARELFAADALARPARLRLFCFPHAGGGASYYNRWAGRLPQGVTLHPARLPGREDRASEQPFHEMAPLVEALAGALEPHAARPFAFFGHSMGAAVAFELARLLRRRGMPPPACLIVSAARAPQFRAGWTPPPEPSEEEFLAQLHRLEGVPPEVLANPELMRVLMPALRADAALYRNYVYSDEPPLACPIRAYGGERDPNVTPAHVEAWSLQTTASFRARIFPGGHFFPQSAEAEFLAALAEDIAGILAGL